MLGTRGLLIRLRIRVGSCEVQIGKLDLVAVPATQLCPNRGAASPVQELRWAAGVAEPAVAPLRQADDHREEVGALLGQAVAVAGALSGLLVGDRLGRKGFLLAGLGVPDGTALADIRYTLETDGGELLYVQSRGVRHGSPEVLARIANGESVDASEYTFRTSTEIETAAPELDWLNKGIFVSVGGRQPSGVIYETYLVD
jgi:hypothetical protein